jgi:hypothetical protein
VGDFFVLQNLQGWFWTGSNFSPAFDDAERFGEEPDPYRDAELKRNWLEGLGHKVHVLYVGKGQLRQWQGWRSSNPEKATG